MACALGGVATLKWHFAPIVLASAVVAGCLTGVPEREFALHPSGARLFCYGCGNEVWHSLHTAITRALAQLEKTSIHVDLSEPDVERAAQRVLVLSRMEYIVASDPQRIPAGSTAAGFTLIGMDGVRKTFDFDWRGPLDVDVSIQCWTYRFEMTEATQWFVTAELIGPLERLGPTAREDLLINTTLACVSGAMNESVADGYLRSIGAGDFAKLAKTLGAAL
jgi:hypothetical protein